MQNLPHVYAVNQELEEKVENLKKESQSWKAAFSKEEGKIDKIKKERDFHRMHHKRLGQEKNKLTEDIKTLRTRQAQTATQIEEMAKQLEACKREKTVWLLEKDKLLKKISELSDSEATSKLETTVSSKRLEVPATNGSHRQPDLSRSIEKTVSVASTMSNGERKMSIPAGSRYNPWSEKVVVPSQKISQYRCVRKTPAHNSSITCLALHPTKNIAVSASDDKTWKMWVVNDGQLIMSGEGHKDWVSDIDFHPEGTHLVSASGDSTLKLWDFSQGMCSHTFTDHKQPVWGCAFHDSGDFVVSASMDKTCKVFDLVSQKCKQTMRGHVDSVNHVTFQPYTNVVSTASGDKTISLWDIRTGLPIQTFYGHKNSCNHTKFNNKGDSLVSTDASGVVKMWDIRMVTERVSIQLPAAANKATFDHSGNFLAIPCDDSLIHIFNIQQGEHTVVLKDHEGAVHTVLFGSPNADELVLSGGSDGQIHYWQ
eukprot:TRINITY_DN17072_c0_g1_i1.p1 TRINITY_DN17072_c0_g1~~TRINITY_DN17072_c0_g1_i1.p1  ORF type:complete len:482 (-),score=85.28 TRINITY_DN17072_c0_g1_i1:18-1463(-)